MKKVTLINGDGIGPEITDAVVKIIEASGLKLPWESPVIIPARQSL